MEVVSMALIGNTVRLKVTFKTSDGTPKDPTSVQLKVYDDDRRTIEDIDLDSDYRESIGTYFYDYTIPRGEGYIAVEFTGKIDGKDVTERVQITREWVR